MKVVTFYGPEDNTLKYVWMNVYHIFDSTG